MTEARITVRLICRSSHNQLLGVDDDVLRARVTAPPIDGAANRALCRLIAKRIGIAPSKVEVVRGGKSREKTVSVAGLDKAELERALQDPDR
ncbi:MAG: DUF167 domain-containing protein [Thermoleophilia bacterium]|nr:DUF167 domain-containing protein [Thermoleophilia bacterium]